MPTSTPDAAGESDKDRILRLMAEQAESAREVKRLRSQDPPDKAAIDKAKNVHEESWRLLYNELKQQLKWLDNKYGGPGVQYTEMVHDFFDKLFEGRFPKVRVDEMNLELKGLVATVLKRQYMDHFKQRKTHREHQQCGLAALAEQQQRHFENLYTTSYSDALDQIEQWEQSGNENLELLAQAMLLHYVAGEGWGVIARDHLGISDERLAKIKLEQLRTQVADQFHKRE